MSMEEIKLKDGEQIDSLLIDNLKIIQKDDNFRYGTDAVLLSRFVKLKENSKVLDIGTGTGIIPLLLSNQNDTSTFVGIDVQEDMVEMANRSSKLNNLENRIEYKVLNIIDANKEFSKRSFDCIVTNPPYKKQNTGIVNEEYKLFIARSEVLCTLEDIIRISSGLLKDKGSFYMVQRIDRLADAIELMRKYKIEPRTLTLVHSDIEKAPILFLIHGIFGAGADLKVTPPLLVK